MNPYEGVAERWLGHVLDEVNWYCVQTNKLDTEILSRKSIVLNNFLEFSRDWTDSIRKICRRATSTLKYKKQNASTFQVFFHRKIPKVKTQSWRVAWDQFFIDFWVRICDKIARSNVSWEIKKSYALHVYIYMLVHNWCLYH